MNCLYQSNKIHFNTFQKNKSVVNVYFLESCFTDLQAISKWYETLLLELNQN